MSTYMSVGWPIIHNTSQATSTSVFTSVQKQTFNEFSMDVEKHDKDLGRTVLLDSAEEMRHHAGNNVVARRHGPRPRLVVEPGVLLQVAGGEAVLRAGEPLSPERPVEPPRPQPECLRGTVGSPHDEQGEEPLEKAPWRWRRSCCNVVVHRSAFKLCAVWQPQVHNRALCVCLLVRETRASERDISSSGKQRTGERVAGHGQ